VKRVLGLSLAALGALGIAACTVTAPLEDEDYPPPPTPRDAGPGAKPDGAVPATDGGASSAPANVSCPYTGTPIPTSGFAACLDGGRCVPTATVPDKDRARLAPCPTGLCVPEKVVAAAGNHVPKTCVSFAGAEGRCTSLVFPDLAKQKDTLPVDTCDANERCAPCFDPSTGADTGACSSVTCDAPKKPKVVFAECCIDNGKARGKCLPVSLLPGDTKDSLETKECAGGKAERCVPTETLAPAYQAPACNGSSFLGNYKGVCVSTCVKRDFFTQIGTSQGNCASGSFCAPCNDPITGAPTGAPGCPK
jgi:hypothetical protein